MTQKLALIDDTQTVLAMGPQVMTCALAVRIEGLIGDVAADALGTALNALYARAILAVYGNASVQALTMAVHEGRDDGPSLEVEIAREAYAASSGGFTLHLTALYPQTIGATDRREALLSALTTALAAPMAPPSLSVRERALAALRAHFATTLATTIERNADRPGVVGATRTILLDGDQEIEAEDGPTCTRYRCKFGLELFAPDSDEPALSARLAAALAATAAADRLGGLVDDVQAEAVDPAVLRDEYTGPALAARWASGSWANRISRVDPVTSEHWDVPLAAEPPCTSQCGPPGRGPGVFAKSQDGRWLTWAEDSGNVARLDLTQPVTNCTALVNGQNPCIQLLDMPYQAAQGATPIRRPHSLAYDTAGNLWVTQWTVGADTEPDGIIVVSADWTRTIPLRLGAVRDGSMSSTGIVVAPVGTVVFDQFWDKKLGILRPVP